MNSDSTISLQELRRDPIAFLQQINSGKTVTVIYHSKPYATIKSASATTPSEPKSGRMLLTALTAARAQAIASGVTLPANKSLKEIYWEAEAKKHGFKL